MATKKKNRKFNLLLFFATLIFKQRRSYFYIIVSGDEFNGM